MKHFVLFSVKKEIPVRYGNALNGDHGFKLDTRTLELSWQRDRCRSDNAGENISFYASQYHEESR
jgi:hypothetical protein